MEEYFSFLDELRETGDINMFDAALPLQDEFGLSKDEAYDVLEKWMESYGRRRSDVN